MSDRTKAREFRAPYAECSEASIVVSGAPGRREGAVQR